jgi:NAD(P)-dependent dehydrogenase (short-subunit alcohol dehydrogenase family)
MLNDKVAVIAGGNSGIGLVTAHYLGRMGIAVVSPSQVAARRLPGPEQSRHHFRRLVGVTPGPFRTSAGIA